LYQKTGLIFHEIQEETRRERDVTAYMHDETREKKKTGHMNPVWQERSVDLDQLSEHRIPAVCHIITAG